MRHSIHVSSTRIEFYVPVIYCWCTYFGIGLWLINTTTKTKSVVRSMAYSSHTLQKSIHLKRTNENKVLNVLIGLMFVSISLAIFPCCNTQPFFIERGHTFRRSILMIPSPSNSFIIVVYCTVVKIEVLLRYEGIVHWTVADPKQRWIFYLCRYKS